ncbi:hypothetical protein GCM10011584_03150 [Nocardioides phosphati]|uniref:Sulfotransferase family protein n=1 Tax=Nocardioides phosphati TaxID=1867775 RepID=A0ABQ2N6U3_9ACTN|nr:hypothetical protein [Nocardioides phosphati]GGO84772.1 hypothetical protein GCM10011584_03150 [Nocardioides phosphati]
MARRVFWHIGLPKTGTTYLQGVLWDNREALRADGLLLPGRGHREHLWAALEVQGRDLTQRAPRAPGAWERLATAIEEHEGDALLSHEFFCGASQEQAERAIARLAPAEVHVIVTARHTAAMLTAGWQEQVKNGGLVDLRTLAATDDNSEFGWRTWDLRGVLERWTSTLPADHVHLLPMPGRSEPADRHWQNFREVLGLPDTYAAPPAPANPSLGVVQVELLRRVNAHLSEFRKAIDRGVWIRGYLAEQHLAVQKRERFGLPEDLLQECRSRAEAAVRLITERGFHVAGDPAALLVPEELPASRQLESVTEAEMLEAAGALIATMLEDRREQAKTIRALRNPPPAAAAEPEPEPVRGWFRRAQRHAGK